MELLPPVLPVNQMKSLDTTSGTICLSGARSACASAAYGLHALEVAAAECSPTNDGQHQFQEIDRPLNPNGGVGQSYLQEPRRGP